MWVGSWRGIMMLWRLRDELFEDEGEVALLCLEFVVCYGLDTP